MLHDPYPKRGTASNGRNRLVRSIQANHAHGGQTYDAEPE
jgi:hypothetical protein